MARFVKFKRANKDVDVYINPEKVSIICPRFNDENTSEVYFTNGDEYVAVKGTAAEVAKSLSVSIHCPKQ